MCEFGILFLRSRFQSSHSGHLRNPQVLYSSVFDSSHNSVIVILFFSIQQGSSFRTRIEWNGQQPHRLLHGLLHWFMPENAVQRQIAAILLAVLRGQHMASAERWWEHSFHVFSHYVQFIWHTFFYRFSADILNKLKVSKYQRFNPDDRAVDANLFNVERELNDIRILINYKYCISFDQYKAVRMNIVRHYTWIANLSKIFIFLLLLLLADKRWWWHRRVHRYNCRIWWSCWQASGKTSLSMQELSRVRKQKNEPHNKHIRCRCRFSIVFTMRNVSLNLSNLICNLRVYFIQPDIIIKVIFIINIIIIYSRMASTSCIMFDKTSCRFNRNDRKQLRYIIIN